MSSVYMLEIMSSVYILDFHHLSLSPTEKVLGLKFWKTLYFDARSLTTNVYKELTRQ